MKSIWSYLLIFAALAMTSCEQEGPAEKAGKKVDEAVDEAQEGFDEATEDLDDENPDNSKRY